VRTEFLGVFGLSWQEKLASDLYNLYADNSLKLGFLATIGHGTSWNVAYINQMESSYKEGMAKGYTGSALADYMRSVVSFDNPAMADSYINLRSTEGGSGFENLLTSVTSPVAKAAGGIVENVSSPLTKPLAIIAVIAVVGLIAYSQIGKSAKSSILKAVKHEA
jgi:hypothetical protein